MVSPYNCKFKVTSGYKLPQRPDHCGLDLVGVDNKNIYSTINGVVGFAGWENASNKKQGFGQYVRIIDSTTGYHYYFGHLLRINVKVGQRVMTGTLIGVEGNTGHSTGSHLHYEVRKQAGADYKGSANVAAISGIPNAIGTYTSGGGTTAPSEKPGVWKIGSTDKSSVINIQKCLCNAGYSIVIDGNFGANTAQAVIKFQSKYGLTPDGIVGNKTWLKLQEWLR